MGRQQAAALREALSHGHAEVAQQLQKRRAAARGGANDAAADDGENGDDTETGDDAIMTAPAPLRKVVQGASATFGNLTKLMNQADTWMEKHMEGLLQDEEQEGGEEGGGASEDEEEEEEEEEEAVVV